MIIPVHNAEKHLKQCLGSVIAQTERDIEIICVDDGSIDSSLQILHSYAASDDRISIITQEQKGAGAARNIGLDQAKGKYLSFLDADDFFEADMLQTAGNRADLSEADVVVYGTWVYSTQRNSNRQAKWLLNTSNIPNKDVFSSNDMPDLIFNTFANCAWNKLIRADFVKNNNLRFQEIRRANDLFFSQSVICLADRISVIDKCFVHYRSDRNPNDTSLQSNNDIDPITFYSAYKKLGDFLRAKGLYEKFEKSYLNLCLEGVVYNVNSLRSLESLKKLLDAVRSTIEAELGLLKLPANTFYNPDSISQYKDICECKLSEYLFKRCLNLNLRLEDSHWYSDWLEWRLAQSENSPKDTEVDGSEVSGFLLKDILPKALSLFRRKNQ